MPTAIVEGPEIQDKQVKKKMVEEITKTLSEAYGLPEEIMIVLIKENHPDNVGTGGELLSDK